MSAEVLRRAAALMRERAEAANKTAGVWFDKADMAEAIERADLWDTQDDPWADAAHIASWHPAVALATADLLERLAEDREMDPYLTKHFDEAAVSLARAYLGESA